MEAQKTLPTLEKLEDVYADLLSIVKREVEVLKAQDSLEDKQTRSLETYDKILRSALERFESKKPKGEFSEVATEDLMKDF